MTTLAKRATICAAAGVLVFAAGCGQRLQPAPGAQVVPGDPRSAMAEEGGIRISARANDWRGDPSNLNEVVTPVRLRIENNSPAPVRIRYNEFSIVTGTGFRAMALPPRHITGTVDQLQPVTVAPGFGFSRFQLAPFWGPYYPGVGVWPGPFAYDPFYYDTAWVRWARPLPTTDMIRRAIPEGVIQSDGHVEGFIFFNTPGKDVRSMTVEADFVHAQTEQQIASLRIPFVRR
ncbi:MAG: hypothetical protein ACK5AZ_10430 [Bryobacteraceae bacterium]